ncbi:hypothetical protein U9M48_028718 [Paspalum notatum var. saurae]|uniref:Uncharacterized protein n=1 Tax=Paspalum notatum var. saurae TaxID=547442 RepID=A0AAQ3X0H9_PASNO
MLPRLLQHLLLELHVPDLPGDVLFLALRCLLAPLQATGDAGQPILLLAQLLPFCRRCAAVGAGFLLLRLLLLRQGLDALRSIPERLQGTCPVLLQLRHLQLASFQPSGVELQIVLPELQVIGFALPTGLPRAAVRVHSLLPKSKPLRQGVQLLGALLGLLPLGLECLLALHQGTLASRQVCHSYATSIHQFTPLLEALPLVAHLPPLLPDAGEQVGQYPDGDPDQAFQGEWTPVPNLRCLLLQHSAQVGDVVEPEGQEQCSPQLLLTFSRVSASISVSRVCDHTCFGPHDT